MMPAIKPPANPAGTPPTPQAPTQFESDALLSLLECAKHFQGAGERISRKQADALPHAQRAMAWHQRPAGMNALAVQLDGLSEWARSFNIPHDPAAMPAAYATLASMPADLLAKAFERIKASSRDTFRLPLPAAIRAEVGEEIARRTATAMGLTKMEMAIKRGDVEAKPGRNGSAFDEFQKSWAAVKTENAKRADAMRAKPDREQGLRPNLVPNPMLDEIVARAWAEAPAKPQKSVRLPYADDDRPSEDDQALSKPPEISSQESEAGGVGGGRGGNEPVAAVASKNPTPATDDDLSFLTGTVT
jgi:hypothetical protein